MHTMVRYIIPNSTGGHQVGLLFEIYFELAVCDSHAFHFIFDLLLIGWTNK